MSEPNRWTDRVRIKRIYESYAYDPADGFRVLVDRLWPRGIAKATAQVDEWLRDVAPSTDLRKWFNHSPERFAQFAALYRQELTQDPAHQAGVEYLRSKAMNGTVTLLYAAKDPICNHALVLQAVVQAREEEWTE